MNKLMYGGLAILGVLIIVAIIFFTNRCKEPDRMTVALTQLKCAQAIDIGEFRKELCLQLHGTEDCEFNDNDRAPGQQLLFSKVNKCAREALKEANMCIDKYEDL
jgi:hypothetical protein